MFAFVAVLCCLCVVARGQECAGKPQAVNHTLTSNQTVLSIYGTFAGTMVKCNWYLNDMLNATVNGTRNGNFIWCPLPPAIVNFEDDDDDDLTGSPPPGAQTMTGLDNSDIKVDVQLQVYYASTRNPSAANCFSYKISVAGGQGTRPTVAPGSDFGLPACCASALENNCKTACTSNPSFAAVGTSCNQQDRDRISNCTNDDCGYNLCKGNFANSISQGRDDNCTIYTAYQTCLQQIRTNCLAFATEIQNSKTAAANYLSAVCSTTAPPTARVSTQAPTTQPTTPTPLIQNPDEKYVRHCCFSNSGSGACQTACAMAFPGGVDGDRNESDYRRLEYVCGPEPVFQRCLRDQINKPPPTSESPPSDIPTRPPLINQFFNELRKCASLYGGDTACLNSLQFPVTDAARAVTNCLQQKPGVERCFGDTLPRFFDADIVNSECCAEGTGSCRQVCGTEIVKAWTAVLALRTVDGNPLEATIESFDNALYSACQNQSQFEECYKDTPEYNGPSIDEVESAMKTCCDSSPPSGSNCQQACTDLKATNSKRPAFESCFTYAEKDFLSCVVSESGSTAMGIRNLFRSQFYDQYKHYDVSSCCNLTQSNQCRGACPAAVQMSNPVPPSWYASCRNNAQESQALNCISNVKYGPCDSTGCTDNLQFCSGFNSRPENYRLCGSLLDALAAASYNEWLTDRAMTVGQTSVALQNIDTCDPAKFKALACFLMAQPCHRANNLAFICWDDCTRIFSSCKSANESLSAEEICRRLGSSQDNCFDLDSFATASEIIVRTATVELELTNKQYTKTLVDYGSADYTMLKGQVKTEFEALFQSSPGVQTIDVDGFSQGESNNVIVNFTITSRSYSQQPFLRSLIAILQNAVSRGAAGSLQLAEGSLSFQVLDGADPKSGFAVLMASYELLLTGVLLCFTLMFTNQ